MNTAKNSTQVACNDRENRETARLLSLDYSIQNHNKLTSQGLAHNVQENGQNHHANVDTQRSARSRQRKMQQNPLSACLKSTLLD